MQGQAGTLQGQVELAVQLWAVQYFPVGIDDPYFRLPTQPKVVDGWGGTGEIEQKMLVGREETQQGVAQGPDAEGEEKEKREARNSTEKKPGGGKRKRRRRRR